MKDKPPNFQYWADGSKKDIEVADNLFDSGYYPQCLFFCHLSLEKLLKAIIVKRTNNKKNFVSEYLKTTRDLFLWLKKEFQKK